ncbi:hypothetical protein DEO72_LG2g3825 [Vigna unguiculata]|uniref:Uncharacterized protein n=1 Tax=Vigna unguiculata TaxID=3917 RepID=A0A4D6L4P1_VIGUN|nr:hypothetical protein DEO72_LG2g3824 [Vigna unguiculata]QCD83481.1 hypothetical protein DEO72_LG2g3825 [Vigna unguiculata]
MVINLFTSRPSARQWSLIFLCHINTLCKAMVMVFSQHQGPLQGNGHRSLYIKTLCEAMVNDFLVYIKTLCEAMVIDFLCHIKTLYETMVIDLFKSRPSARQWSSISLNQDPL